MTPGLMLGVDIGGTGLRAGLVRADGSSPVPLVDVPRGPDLRGQLAEIAGGLLGPAAAAGMRVTGAGIAVPGHLDPRTGLVSSAPGAEDLLGLDPRDIDLGPVQVTHVVNDANAALIGEWLHGAARGARSALGVFVGTGVGGGLVAGGALFTGSSGTAGEIGHLPLLPDGPRCPCGGRGCLQQLASGTAVARWYGERTGQAVAGAAAVAAAARAGDRLAQEAFARAGEWLGVGIATALNLLNTEIVVVGGGVAAAWDLLGPRLTRTANRLTMPATAAACRIVPTALGRRAGVVGAALARTLVPGALMKHGTGDGDDR
ncbi:ROK family protein [Streptomyces sp. NPDC090741]|uniref:ROK family protein n=1 Tax=Streptomyces sp. NPDC090741 TaxID=3365967 RepID=UPI0037FD07A4